MRNGYDVAINRRIILKAGSFSKRKDRRFRTLKHETKIRPSIFNF